MANSINIKLSELSDREKSFLKEYQELYVECNENNEDFKLALKVLSKGFKDISDLNALEKKLYEVIKEKYLFDNIDHKEYEISPDFLKLVEKNIPLPKLKLKFTKGGIDVNFTGFKVRGEYIISCGDDRIIRIFKYDNEKKEVKFIKEVIFDNLKEYNFSNLYDLYDEKYLFYSNGNNLTVYNIITDNIIYNKDMFERIDAIELKENKIFVFDGKISQPIIVKNEEILFDRAINSKTAPNILFDYEINDENIYIKDNNIFFGKKENDNNINNVHQYKSNKGFFVVTDEKNRTIINITDNINLTMDQIILHGKFSTIANKIDDSIGISLIKATDIKIYKSYISIDELYKIIGLTETIIKNTMVIEKNLISKIEFNKTNYYNQNNLNMSVKIKNIINKNDDTKIFNENKEKKLIGYYKYDNYLNLIYEYKENNYLITFKCEKEKANIVFQMSCKKIKAELKEIPKDMEIHVFDDGFVIIKNNKAYGTNNWKDYVQFVEGLEIKHYSTWESYYDNAWEFEIFEKL